MKLIKLDAIDSTNEFLKGLSSEQALANFTVVTAESQTKGKGQMGSTWSSEVGKNLIMSVFIKNIIQDINQIYTLNVAVTLAVVQVLESLQIPELTIKWPNDIMSYNFKIAGILIENNIKSDGSLSSIVGLGLNVNQENFENLPKASSLTVICRKQFDKEILLHLLSEKIKKNTELIATNHDFLWEEYRERLFKKEIPMTFKDSNERYFMGIIKGVSDLGKLQLILENDQSREYAIKEIQMLY
jgi:BirA family biotin operon repressor/biotin-[acetyl-CoA-carboxylase] ligase